MIELEIETARRLLGPQRRRRDVRHLAGRGIELADELMAEVRVPDHAILIHDDVMGLRVFARQVVFGDDDVGRAAGQARERLERKFHRLRVAEIHAGEIVGHLLLDRPRHRRTVGIVAAGQEQLRMRRRRAGRVGAHALEHLHELGGVMGRLHDALHGMASRRNWSAPPSICRRRAGCSSHSPLDI